MTLLDPKNDFVFKTLMARTPEALVSLINAVRADEPPIESAELLNPGIEPDELDGKFIVLDILARDALGRCYNIEMQMNYQSAWSARSIYYLARLIGQQLGKGEDYHQLRSVIGIHLLDFELFRAGQHAGQAVWCFELRDRRCPALRLGEELQLNLIELPKADRLAAEAGTTLADWVAFLAHWREDSRMAQIENPPIQQALDQLRHLSADERTRYLAGVRERALVNERLERAAQQRELHAAHEEGWREGRLEGEAAILERLLTRRFGLLDEAVRARLYDATGEQLEHWSDRVLDATSLQAVFETQ